MQKPDAADPPGHAVEAAQVVRGTLEVAERELVGHREQALHHRLRVARVGRPAFAREQIDAERDVADVGKAVADVADVVSEPAGLVDHHDPRVLEASAGRAR